MVVSLIRNSSPRRRRASAAALFVLMLVAVWLGLSAAARAQEIAAMPTPWIVLESRGPAEVRHDRGSWLPLMSGAVVAAASEIRTGPAAEVVLKRGEDRVRLLGQSYLELPPAAPDDAMTRVVQWLGQALFEVDHRPEPHFEVDTPYLTAVVKGTAFAVEVTREGSAVAVTQGVVAVGTPGGAASLVAAGMTARGYAGLSGLTLEDGANGATPEAPPADADHQWPAPDFQPITRSFPQM
jgi:ferric-dicitrate binding protein FerR (iron transport regulator)